MNFHFYGLNVVPQLTEHLASHWNFEAEENDESKYRAVTDSRVRPITLIEIVTNRPDKFETAN